MRRPEHDLDEAVDMAAGAVDLQRHLAPQLEPALEHHIMLALVGAVLLDRGDELAVVGAGVRTASSMRSMLGIAAMLVIDVDRAEQVEIAACETRRTWR